MSVPQLTQVRVGRVILSLSKKLPHDACHPTTAQADLTAWMAGGELLRSTRAESEGHSVPRPSDVKLEVRKDAPIKP